MLVSEQDYQSISELQKALADGKITVSTVVQHYLKSIEALNPQLNAVTVLNSRAVEDAERLDVRFRFVHCICP